MGLIGGEGGWEDVYTGCQCRQDALVTTSAKERGRCSEGKINHADRKQNLT